MKTNRLHIATFIAACSLFPIPPANAQVATLCVNCSDQVTQFLNYGQLLTQTATSASQLATQVSQYMTMIQNLQQLPAKLMGDVLSPYKDQISDLTKLYDATNALYQSANMAKTSIDGTLKGGVAMKMDPVDYLKYVAAQAKTRGGVYKQMLDANNQRMQDLQKTSTAFQKAAENVPNLQGNLDSLAQLNTLAATSGKVATELLSLQRQAMSMQVQESVNQESANEALSEANQLSIQERAANFKDMRDNLKANKKWK